MASEVTADVVTFATLRAHRVGVPVPLAIPTSGVIQIQVGQASAITLGSGVIYGIHYVDENGTEVELADIDDTDIKFLRAATGASVTILHEQTLDGDGAALPANRRTITSSGNTVTLTGLNSQTFFAYVPALTSFRWFVADHDAFIPTTPGDWDPPVKYISEAINRMSAALAGLLGGPIP